MIDEGSDAVNVRSAISSTSFITLPLEIRQQIYESAFSTSPCLALPLLCVSRQVYREAQPYLFKRPLVFSSQQKLYDWMRQTGPRQLHHVRSLGLAIKDPGCHTKFLRSLHEDHRDRSISPIARMYEDERLQLAAALTHLPSVHDLTIYKSRGSPNSLYEAFSQSCLIAIMQNFSMLRNLTCYTCHISLELPSSLSSLRSLRITGFSTTPPNATLHTLKRLKHLDELQLIGPPPGLSFQQRNGHTSPSICQSIVPRVIRCLRPLKSFGVCEIRDPIANQEGYFFHEDMVLALHQGHRGSLRTLRISSDFEPSTEFVEALVELMSESALENLHLGWPGMDLRVICAMPPTLRKLQLLVSNALDPQEAAEKILAEQDWLPGLTEVVLLVDPLIEHMPVVQGVVGAAIDLLSASKIRTLRRTWCPIRYEESAHEGER